MLILQQQRILFIAVPKTGSTAIETALRPHATVFCTSPPELKHITLRRFHNKLGPLIGPLAAELEPVAIIREPVAWLGSWWRYRSRRQAAERDTSTQGMSFAEFVGHYLSDPAPGFAAVGRQRPMVAHDRRPARLFRYESDAFWRFISDRMATELPAPPRLNVSPGGDETLPADLRQRLDAALAGDRELWEGAEH